MFTLCFSNCSNNRKVTTLSKETLTVLTHNVSLPGVRLKFLGVGEGNSERCRKWGGGVGVIYKDSFQKYPEIGGGKRQKLFVGGRGYRRCHDTHSPHKNFAPTPGGNAQYTGNRYAYREFYQKTPKISSFLQKCPSCG